MFSIGYNLDNDETPPGRIVQIFRTLCSLIDLAVYSLVTVVYQILFTIADTTIFSSTLIKDFYSRIQLIIGVFMIFKLSISLLQAVINPDYLTDQKKGMGKIITRIIVMLAMFVAIMPLSIPLTQAEKDAVNEPDEVKSFNYHLNQSGLLFGTMYSLQERILKGNVLGKLVFGNNDNNYKIDRKTGSTKSLDSQANQLAVYILKGFVRINLTKEAANSNKTKITTDDYICSKANGGDNYSDDERAQIDRFIKGETINDVVGPDVLSEWCNDGVSLKGFLDWAAGEENERWTFTYLPIVPTVCGVILLLVLLGYCIDIAIRTIKLAILRLLAPIPIISYVDPKSSENGSFAAWTKALISTYVDLFIRLAIIYFVISLVQEICNGKLDLPVGQGIIGVLATVFIIIGLFYFAKMAPKFIRDALGLKGMMSNVGLSALIGATGSLVGGAGVKGAIAGGLTAAENSAMASAQGKEAPPAWSTGRDLAAQIRTGNEKAKGGIINRLNDNLTRGAMINQAARRYGVTRDTLDIAKGNMYGEQNELKRREGDLERFNNNMLDEADLNRIFSDENGYEGYTTGRDANGRLFVKDENGNEVNIRDQLYNRYEDQQKTYGQAKTHYEEAAKFAEQHRVEPTFEEQHRRPFLARRNNDINIGTDHQSMTDRVWGRRVRYDTNGNPMQDENGDNVFERNRDNTWDPNHPDKFD